MLNVEYTRTNVYLSLYCIPTWNIRGKSSGIPVCNVTYRNKNQKKKVFDLFEFSMYNPIPQPLQYTYSIFLKNIHFAEIPLSSWRVYYNWQFFFINLIFYFFFQFPTMFFFYSVWSVFRCLFLYYINADDDSIMIVKPKCMFIFVHNWLCLSAVGGPPLYIQRAYTEYIKQNIEEYIYIIDSVRLFYGIMLTWNEH